MTALDYCMRLFGSMKVSRNSWHQRLPRRFVVSIGASLLQVVAILLNYCTFILPVHCSLLLQPSQLAGACPIRCMQMVPATAFTMAFTVIRGTYRYLFAQLKVEVRVYHRHGPCQLLRNLPVPPLTLSCHWHQFEVMLNRV